MKKIILCIGQPKSGTTWLYSMLARKEDEFNLPIKKELNYWNTALYKENVRPTIMSRLPKKMLSKFKIFNKYDYRFLYQSADDTKVFLDFSPTYMLMSAEELEEPKKYFDNIKYIICEREASSRIVSHILYSNRRKITKIINYISIFIIGKIPKKYTMLSDTASVKKILYERNEKENILIVNYSDIQSKSKELEKEIRNFLQVPVVLEYSQEINKRVSSNVGNEKKWREEIYKILS